MDRLQARWSCRGCRAGGVKPEGCREPVESGSRACEVQARTPSGCFPVVVVAGRGVLHFAFLLVPEFTSSSLVSA